MKVILLLCVFFSSSAYATLGEHVSQITENEGRFLKVSNKRITQASSAYTVHELTVDGATVKEYADANGVVFAVSWNGMKTPDLSVIFGSYYTEYKVERENIVRVKGVRSVSVKTGSLVVNSGGHMRNLNGFAHIPSLVPAGLDLATLN